MLLAQVSKSQSNVNLGLEIGQSSIIGDIESLYFNGYAAEIYLKKELHEFINYEPTIHISRNHGLSNDLFGAGLVSSTNWFPAYRNTNIILFQNFSSSIGKKSNRVIFEPKLGIGLGSSRTKFNVLDANFRPYENIEFTSGYTIDNPNYLANVQEIHDDSYETDVFRQVGIFRLGDNAIDLYYTAGFRLLYKLQNSFLIGISHSYIFSNSDYLEGIRFRNDSFQSNSTDIIQSTRLLFEYSFN